MHWYTFREWRALRAFWHLTDRSSLKVEFYWWTRHCHAGIDVSDEDWTLSLALPPLAIWISLAGFGLWKPTRESIATWDGNRVFRLTDERECRIAVHDWAIWVNPWSRQGEWCAADPWWVRGLTFNLRNLLGRQQYTCETLREGMPVRIQMSEGVYHGVAKMERQTWKRPLWFTQTRTSTWINVPKGIPFQGKGENSWDCGDDGLFGCGVDGESIDLAVEHFRQSVLRNRARYGKPSPKAIAEALA